MIVLRNKSFGLGGLLNKLNNKLISRYNPNASKSSPIQKETREATSDEIKKSIVYKLFPTIDPEVTDFIDSEKLKNLKTSGLKDKKFLVSSIENSIWEYEKGVSNMTGVTEKDIKGNIDIFAIYEITDSETIILSTNAKKGSSLSRKLPDFYWDVEINLRTGISDVAGAGD